MKVVPGVTVSRSIEVLPAQLTPVLCAFPYNPWPGVGRRSRDTQINLTGSHRRTTMASPEISSSLKQQSNPIRSPTQAPPRLDCSINFAIRSHTRTKRVIVGTRDMDVEGGSFVGRRSKAM